jgi:hypothetical protein
MNDSEGDDIVQDITRNKIRNINTTEEDSEAFNSRPNGGSRDSPDFNRHNNNNDDLTVSNTLVSNNNTTYRGIDN